MDSQRRHDLDENSLQKALGNAPGFFRDYGSYALLAIAIIAVGIWVWRVRSNTAQQEQLAVRRALYTLAQTVSSTQDLRSMAPTMAPDLYTQERDALVTDFNTFAQIAADSDAPGVRSHALRLRGDFAWAMATLPSPSAILSTTQPATQPAALTAPERSPEEWLAEAESAYQQVVERYSQQTGDVLAALFGLAAVAEQRGNFEGAGPYYEQILAREDVGEAVKDTVRQRQQLLPYLVTNPRLATPTPAASGAAAPATQPAATQPSGGLGQTSNEPAAQALQELLARPEDVASPATRPVTQPAPPPSTRPSTQPVE